MERQMNLLWKEFSNNKSIFKTYQNAKSEVLLIGINPQFIDFSNLPSEINAAMIRQEAVLANEQLIAAGYNIYNCFIDLGKTAEATVMDLLDMHNFDLHYDRRRVAYPAGAYSSV